MAVLKAVALHNPRPLREINPAVPKPLANLVMKLLAKNPADRPASAREVAGDLDAIARDPNSPRLASQRWKAKPAVLIGVSMVLVVALCVGAYFKWWRPAAAAVADADTNPAKAGPSPEAPKVRPSGSGTESANPLPVMGTLNAGGSTFIDPLMEKWGSVYRKENGIKLNYVPTGSGAGIQQLTSQTLDFCCSDVPMSVEQLKQARANGGEVLHVPLALGGIVPAYNLPGLSKPLRFSGNVLAGIYLGDIKKWNDPAYKRSTRCRSARPDILAIHALTAAAAYLADFLARWQGLERGRSCAAVKWPVGEKQGKEGMVKALVKKQPLLMLNSVCVHELMFGAVKNKQELPAGKPDW